jgi:hypothetical protein
MGAVSWPCFAGEPYRWEAIAEEGQAGHFHRAHIVKDLPHDALAHDQPIHLVQQLRV